MPTAMKRVFFVILLAIAGCAPAGPPFASVAATLPPLAPGMARIFFYRWYEPYETLVPTTAFLNGRAVGITESGAVLYRDVAPGQYIVAVQSQGIYPNQFKTVVLRPGDVAYARIESLRSWSACGGGGAGGGGGGACWDTFVVNLMDPIAAQAEMRDLRFIPG
jgi:hypothetical protein